MAKILLNLGINTCDMKRVLLLMAFSGLVLSACQEDIIATTDDPVETPAKNDDDQDPEEGQGDYDDISLTEFSRTISITWNGSTVSVSGDDNGIVSVSGADVTVDNSKNDEFVRYELSGSSSDGSLKIYSLRRLALVLNSLELTNAGGAAINVQTHKRTFVVLNGSSKLADGSVNSSGDYPEETDAEDMKAAFFSEAQLVFSGSGSLSVTANGKAGITSDDYLRFMGTQTVSSTSSNGHALRGKDGITVYDGTISASASAAGKKGMSSDASVSINGGSISIKVSGGVLSEQVTTNGTTATEYTASSGIKADSTFVMTGGVLDITNSGQGGKGISGDMNALFKGGRVKVNVTGSNYGSSGSGGGPGGGPGGRPGGGGNSGSSSSSNDSSKSAKGIKFDGDIIISGGSINVSSASHQFGGRHDPQRRLRMRLVNRERRPGRQRQPIYQGRMRVRREHQGQPGGGDRRQYRRRQEALPAERHAGGHRRHRERLQHHRNGLQRLLLEQEHHACGVRQERQPRVRLHDPGLQRHDGGVLQRRNGYGEVRRQHLRRREPMG